MSDKINEICNELRKHYAILDKHTYITIRDKEPKQEFSRTISKDGEDIGGINLKVGTNNITIDLIALSPEYRSRDHNFRKAIALLFCDPKIGKLNIIPVDEEKDKWEAIGVDITNEEVTREDFFKSYINHI